MANNMFRDIKFTDWVTASATLLGLICGIWVISQNTTAIKTASDALRVSLVPTLAIEYPSTEKPGSFTIQNTGAETIASVDVFPTCYLVTTDEAREIVSINHSSSLLMPAYERLEKGEQIALSATKIIEACPILMPVDTSMNRFLGLVIVFNREIDSKRFVHIELFGGVMENGVPIAIPTYQTSNSGMGGGRSVTGLVASIRKIEETERAFFRINQ